MQFKFRTLGCPGGRDALSKPRRGAVSARATLGRHTAGQEGHGGPTSLGRGAPAPCDSGMRLKAGGRGSGGQLGTQARLGQGEVPSPCSCWNLQHLSMVPSHTGHPENIPLPQPRPSACSHLSSLHVLVPKVTFCLSVLHPPPG